MSKERCTLSGVGIEDPAVSVVKYPVQLPQIPKLIGDPGERYKIRVQRRLFF
jgi:hypothetical protein